MFVDDGPLGGVLLSIGQAQMTADRSHVYVSELNEGEFAEEIQKGTFGVSPYFGQVQEPFQTVVYDRPTGSRIAALPTFGLSLFSDGKIFAQSTPGCCGLGVALYDAVTLRQLSFIPEPYANTAATMKNGQLLVIGTEGGLVVLYDISNPSNPVRAKSIDLRAITSHTGAEDIEIRALATTPDGFIFAASSWGNDRTKSPTLPTLFVLTAN
jgi:hypothetical protein